MASTRHGHLKTKMKSEEWWKGAVFYQFCLRSFADSNNDGVGDLQGLISKLGYLNDGTSKSLGIDAIWLEPIHPSPLVDGGYDISGYLEIDPVYGTMADFEELIREAHQRGIRIIMDLVFNHTSDQHPWFQESKSLRKSVKRDWYIWRGKRDDGGPPNNWQPCRGFGNSAWEYDSQTGQYYYHFFFPGQPDLNWRNPKVKEAIFNVARFWLEKGIDGFRLDASHCLVESERLTDDLIYPQPETHDILKELRKVINEYPGRMLVGELEVPDVSFYGSGDNELHLFQWNHNLTELVKLDVKGIRKTIQAWDTQVLGKGWPTYCDCDNYSGVRVDPLKFTIFSDGQHKEKIAKVITALMFTLRGTPFLAYGEEIGKESLPWNEVSRFKFKDIFKNYTKWTGGRGGVKGPMQWSAKMNAGFSEAQPWAPVHPNYKVKNVAAQEVDPGSLLSWHKQLIWARKVSPALLRGSYIAINKDASDYLSFLRKDKKQICLVVLNMSGKKKIIRFNLSPQGIRSKSARLLLSTHERRVAHDDLNKLEIAPYEVYIAVVLPPHPFLVE